MGLRSGPFGLKLREWLKSGRYRLRIYIPPFRNRHFWLVQILVITIVVIHDVIEIGGYLPQLGMLYFLPISLFFVPVVYAALIFGFTGSIATTFWVVILTIPNWVFWHHGLERLGVIFQMAILVAVSVFVGQRVDRETAARHQAEDAGVALRTYAAHVVRAQEEERRRIARELHDETIQAMTLIHRQLGSMEDKNLRLPSGLADEVKQVQKMTEGAMQKIREFAKSLRPSTLDDLGIVPSIRRLLIDSTERRGINNQFRLVGDERRLPQDMEDGMFRITQEAIWNIERHSKATEIAITITFTDGEVRLDIKDNGIGFKVPPVLSSFYAMNKLGMIGMQERAELLGGKLEVQSSPKKGVTVSVTIPDYHSTI